MPTDRSLEGDMEEERPGATVGLEGRSDKREELSATAGTSYINTDSDEDEDTRDLAATAGSSSIHTHIEEHEDVDVSHDSKARNGTVEEIENIADKNAIFDTKEIIDADEDTKSFYPVKSILASELRMLSPNTTPIKALLVQWDLPGYHIAEYLQWVDARDIPGAEIESLDSPWDDGEFVISRVWAIQGKGPRAKCLVEWEGYPAITDLTWEPKKKVKKLNPKAIEFYELAKEA
ncbi:hypothetical protein BUE80_DR005648 [Diplocarpon rosae]|nr:hypothetical protein BUE80_DR005648 [Diplocarpon rosae]